MVLSRHYYTTSI